jgi:hypothetical protein
MHYFLTTFMTQTTLSRYEKTKYVSLSSLDLRHGYPSATPRPVWCKLPVTAPRSAFRLSIPSLTNHKGLSNRVAIVNMHGKCAPVEDDYGDYR